MSEAEPHMSPELLDARLAMDRGDYATARARARARLADSPSEVLRREAEELLSRTATDRAAVLLALGCVAFFLLVVYSYVLR